MATCGVEKSISLNDPYSHLPFEEIPTPGQPRVDFINGLFAYEQRHKYLNEIIYRKRNHTQNNTPPRRSAVFLTRPLAPRNFGGAPRRKVAEMIAELIRNVYGDGYPLSSKHPDSNLADIVAGKFLPYLGIEGPTDPVGSNGNVYDNPDLLLRDDVIAMAASGIILGDEGFAELGRFTRRQENDHFDGGAIILEMIYDWMRNRHEHMEAIHTLYADMRGAKAHNHSPHSGNVQSLLLGHGGMGIFTVAPMYDVNGIEPMIRVVLYRDPEKVREYNKPRTVIVPPGVDVEFLQALWQNQLGVKANLVVAEENQLNKCYQKAQIDYHGKHIYAGIKITNETQTDNNPNIDEALFLIPKDAPILFAELEAESLESAATQKKLMKQGFIHCGIMPAQKSEYLVDPGNREAGVASYETPTKIYMVKLGEPIRKGEVKLAEAYYPTPDEAKGKELHGRKQVDGTCYIDGDYMRELLYKNDQIIRATIKL